MATIEKQQKKQNKERLQKKLQLRQLNLYEALQQDIAVDWFKQQNPAFLSLLTPQGMKEMINYIIIPGDPNDKMRSYKIPMIATEILSSLMPKVFQLMFTDDKSARGGTTVGWLVEYFWKGQPNYVISGYVVKILNNLMIGNAHKVLEYLIKNCCPKMLDFLESYSVAQFLLRLIIVQDILLNAFIKERLQLFNQIIQLYVQNKGSNQALYNINFMISESFNRLWGMKNKQLGRFVSSLFKIIENIIDYDDKYEEEKILPVIVKLLANFNDRAPFLIMAIYRKLYKKLSTLKPKKMKYQNKKYIQVFQSKNLSLLQSLESIFNQFSVEFLKFIEKQNIFPVLYKFVERFEWNNIVLVQIQKIIKSSIAKKNDKIYDLMINNLFNSIQIWKQGLKTEDNFGRGYKGFLLNIYEQLKTNYSNNQTFKQYIITNNLTNVLQKIVQIGNTQKRARFRVVNQIALPAYKPLNDLCTEYLQFFNETQIINKRYQQQNPADHIKHKQDDVLTSQIEIENQLLYKLMTQPQSNNNNSGNDDGDKKLDDSSTQ